MSRKPKKPALESPGTLIAPPTLGFAPDRPSPLPVDSLPQVAPKIPTIPFKTNTYQLLPLDSL